jgi:multiple sugar transport system permease protein
MADERPLSERLPPVPPVVAAEELAATGEAAIGAAPAHAVPGRERADQARTLTAYVVLALVAVLFAVPFLWSVLTSFKPLIETSNFTFLPKHWTTSAYHDVFSQFSFGRYTLNSFIVAGTVTVSNLFLASIGGYAFARLRFPGRELLFMLVLGTLMIPDPLRLVPVYQLLVNVLPKYLHVTLVPSRLGFILISLVSAQSLFLMRQYFLTIPHELEEAAKLDGAGYFKTYWRVMLPLAAPALAAVAILTFQGTWNGLFWPLIIFQDPSLWTLPIGIAQFKFEYQTFWPQLMAASVVAILPILALYVFFQRYFVAGVAAAAVKG